MKQELLKLLKEYYHYKYMQSPFWIAEPKLDLKDFMRWLESVVDSE